MTDKDPIPEINPVYIDIDYPEECDNDLVINLRINKKNVRMLCDIFRRLDKGIDVTSKLNKYDTCSITKLDITMWNNMWHKVLQTDRWFKRGSFD